MLNAAFCVMSCDTNCGERPTYVEVASFNAGNRPGPAPYGASHDGVGFCDVITNGLGSLEGRPFLSVMVMQSPAFARRINGSAPSAPDASFGRFSSSA